DVEDQQVRLHAADFDQSRDTVGRGRNLVASVSFEERADEFDNFGFVIDNQNVEFSLDQRSGRRYLMLPEKGQQVVMANAAVPSRRAIRGKQILLNPIDNGSRIDVQ